MNNTRIAKIIAVRKERKTNSKPDQGKYSNNNKSRQRKHNCK